MFRTNLFKLIEAGRSGTVIVDGYEIDEFTWIDPQFVRLGYADDIAWYFEDQDVTVNDDGVCTAKTSWPDEPNVYEEATIEVRISRPVAWEDL